MKPRVRPLPCVGDADSYRITFVTPDGGILSSVMSVSSWEARGLSRAEAAYRSLGYFIRDVQRGIAKVYGTQ